MPEIDELLLGALARFNDVERRLVLADWLEEQGDAANAARAELVRLLGNTKGRKKAADAPARTARAREIVAVRPELIGPLAGALTDEYSPLDAGPALLVFLGAGVCTRPADDPFDAGTRWKGTLSQWDYGFPMTLTVREREGNAFGGDMAQDFRSLYGMPRTGRFRLAGAVVGGRRLAFVTDRAEGGVCPGVYVAELQPLAVKGTWHVPSYAIKGSFELVRARRVPRPKGGAAKTG